MSSLREMRIYSIMFDLVAKSPVVILKEDAGDRYLPILIGVFEAAAIEMGLKKKKVARPMTHDLISNLLREMQLAVTQVQIAKI
ncbi:MAG TPA: bifunctional nuclease domain-containing protein, partial [bacterium]|nr:bifunctional nuclease domain-containing protein [bacterium]